MNREINTKVASLVILFFVSLIAAWAYFNSQALFVDSPSFVKLNGKGNPVFLLGNRLYETTPEGEDVHTLSFETLGIDRTLGDFDFFSNGDVLLYAASRETGLLENLQTFFRMEGSQNPEASRNEGFYRCAFYVGRCKPFGRALPAFQRGFRLTIDPDDNVYIADTSRHRLFKTNRLGEKVATLNDGLRFPNDLYWENDTLWIVNTNHHEVLAIKTTTTDFGESLSRFKPNIPGRNFPSDFARSERNWYVLSMDNSMQNGKLGRLNQDGQALEVADTIERGADLTTVTHIGNRLVLADAKHRRYRQLGLPDMQNMPDFSSPAISSHLQQARTQVDEYNRIAWSIAGFGVLAFIILAFFAIRSELKSSPVKTDDDEPNPGLNNRMPEGMSEYWIPMSKQFLQAQKLNRWILPVCGVTICVTFFPVFINSESAAFLLIPVGLLVGVGYFTNRMLNKTSRTGLGISDDTLLIRDPNGKVFSGKGNEIAYSRSAIYLKGAIVMTKTFDTQEFEKWIQPRLQNAQDLGEVGMLVKQWHMKHPLLMEPIKMSVLMLAALLVMKLWG